MPRIRLTLAECSAEATRLATEFIQRLPAAESARCLGAFADRSVPKSASSKHPVAWVVVFVYHPPEVIMDGGELAVYVNLETNEVNLRE